MLTVAQSLIDADPDEGISTDELMAVAGLTPEGVRAALYDLERLGIASNDTVLTAFVHSGVPHASRQRFQQSAALELALIDLLRETAPDIEKGDSSTLHLPARNAATQGPGSRVCTAGTPAAACNQHRGRRTW